MVEDHQEDQGQQQKRNLRRENWSKLSHTKKKKKKEN